MRDVSRATAVACVGGLLALLAVGCSADESLVGTIPTGVNTGFATNDTVANGPTVHDATDTPSEVSESGPESEVVTCKLDDECQDVFTVAPCEDAVCEPVSGVCVLTNRSDGSLCDAAEPCVSTGACAQGACIGQPVDCDDDDPCTDDACNPGSGCVYEHNTAPCDDGNACTTGDYCSFGACAAPEVLDCDDDNPCTSDSCTQAFGCEHIPTNALCDDGDPCTADICSGGICVSTPDESVDGCAALCGNGSCAPDESCQTCPADCGPCPVDPCPAGEIENCTGGCSPATFFGDGACHDELNCATSQFDGGDCATTGDCGPGQLKACDGSCVAEWQVGNGICDPPLDCPEFDFDNGDCATVGACELNEVEDCTGACAPMELMMNGVCDPALDCELFNYDFGDCGPPVCAASEYTCFDGGCILLGQVCDGFMDCLAGDDEIDCDPGTECNSWEKPNCEGGCTHINWFGDNQCDAELNCLETAWDEGDCVGACPYTEFQDCLGACHPTDDAVGDGVCDANWNCTEYEQDEGDCASSDPCAPGETKDCLGGCTSATVAASKVGDGTCDPEFNCATFVSDGLDCESNGCGSWELPDCEGGCTQSSWFGDNQCDAILNCEATDWDLGDCVGVCPYDQYKDCLGECQETLEGFGDGVCDAIWNCDVYVADAGDCSSAACSSDEYVCPGDGKCLATAYVCDGVEDCVDGADELDCDPDDGCYPNQMVDCGGGCTFSSWFGDEQCDATLNCAALDFDGGDCAEGGSCDVSAGELKNCLGQCVGTDQLTKLGNGTCDAQFNCELFVFDANDCLGDEIMCAPSEFQCETSMICLPQALVCNGMVDCPEGEDETAAACGGTASCFPNQTEDCGGSCTFTDWLGDGACDQSFNCAQFAFDNGDCADPSFICAPEDFVCPGDFLCLPQALVCDGFADCMTGDDEVGCGGSGNCSGGEFAGCDGSCYASSWFGDGNCDELLDCAEAGWDGTDCSPNGSCTPGQFQCIDGDCLAIGWHCDGMKDCTKGEDEIGCGVDL